MFVLCIASVSCSRPELIITPVPKVEFTFDFDEYDDENSEADVYIKYGDMLITGASGQIEALDVKLVQQKPGKSDIILSESGNNAGLDRVQWTNPLKFDAKIPFYVSRTEYRSNVAKLYRSLSEFKADKDLVVIARFIEGKTVRTVTCKNDDSSAVINMMPTVLSQ